MGNLGSLVEAAASDSRLYCESGGRYEGKVFERVPGYKRLDFPQSASTSNGGGTCLSHSPRATKFSSERPLAGGRLISPLHGITGSISKLCVGEGDRPKTVCRKKNTCILLLGKCLRPPCDQEAEAFKNTQIVLYLQHHILK